MRISDWSSDVCSSDIDPALGQANRYVGLSHRSGLRVRFIIDTHTHADHFSAVRQLKQEFGAATVMHRESPSPHVEDRKSVVSGKSVSVRVALGGRRVLTKKKIKKTKTHTNQP